MKTKSERIVDGILLGFLIAYITFEILPIFKNLRSNLWVSLGISIALFGVLVYYSWFRSNKPSLLCRIIGTALGSLYIFLPYVLSSHRTFSLIVLCLSVVSVAAIEYFMFFDAVVSSAGGIAVLFFESAAFISRMIRYATVTEEIGGSLNLKYIGIALLLSGIVGALVCFILKNNKLPEFKKRRTKKERKEVAGVAIVFIVVTALFISYLSLETLNFALDSSKPNAHICTIQDKKMRAGGRYRRAFWRIEIEIDGENKWIDISSSEYDFYRIGDTITINLYDGFLNEPYLITENMD